MEHVYLAYVALDAAIEAVKLEVDLALKYGHE